MANITKEFLEEALGQQVQHFKTDAGSSVGDGHTSNILTIKVTLPTQEILHLALKAFPSHPSRQTFLSKGNIYYKEFCVYQTLAQELVKFQRENLNSVIKPPFPHFIYGRAVNYTAMLPSEIKECDPLDNCILMADMRNTKGFKLTDRLTELDLDHCQLILQALATLHGLTWAYKERSNVQRISEKFPFLAETFFDLFDHQMFTALHESARGLFCDALEKGIEDQNEKVTLIEAVTKAKVKAIDMMSLYCSEKGVLSDSSLNKDNCLRVPREIVENEIPWHVAVHGDCHSNNMLFRYDKVTKKPVEAVLLDLQGTREGDPMSDIVMCLFLGTTSVFRKKHMDDLLELYRQKFGRVCEHFKVSPPKDFTLREIQRRFHRAQLYGLVNCFMGLPFILNDPKDAVDLDKLKEGATKDDMIQEMANSTQNVKKSTKFEDRVVDLVRGLYADGII